LVSLLILLQLNLIDRKYRSAALTALSRSNEHFTFYFTILWICKYIYTYIYIYDI